ncbi:hypothetical protein [Paradesulfitobacterium ferrireducens]|uniref:hypothetical protein n=1 Tax=Paradesulfitobacterium ferrireducens TaxID=2816476 RepID=UPI001A8D7E10|nr:hypothetical protein [Paradesulfitobacterium ferrireducens]
MNIPILALIFQGIPEQIALVTLAFVIKRMPLKWKLIVPIGLVLAIVSFLIRLLALPFGLHTIFIVILLFISLIWAGKGDISLSLLASLLSVLALILFESLSLSILMPLLGITSESLLTDFVLRIFLGEPQVILIFLSAYFVNRLLHKRK